MPTILRSELFWVAFGSLVALVGLVSTPLGNLIPYLKNRRLQKALDRERKFYDQQPNRPNPDEEISNYIFSIKNALQTINNFSEQQRVGIKDKLRGLIKHLQATHDTLVTHLKPFGTIEGKQFFKKFDKTNQNLDAVWKTGGGIRHEARTHCGEVEHLVEEIISQLEKHPGNDLTNQIQGLRQIGYSMISADQDIIVPIMNRILRNIKAELLLIGSSVRQGNKLRAIFLKEKYKFDTGSLLKELSEALEKMNELEKKL